MPYTPPRSSQPPQGHPFELSLSQHPQTPHHRSSLTPVSFLLRAALITPRKTAIIHPERGYSFTYEQWAARTLSLAFALQSLPGYKVGDRVAVISPNAPLISDAHWAIPAIGGIITPINIRNTPKEVAYVLEHSGSTIILCDHEFAHLVPENPGPNVTVVISKDSGGQDPTDGYEKFLDQGWQAWQQAEQAELQRYKARTKPSTEPKTGWKLILAPKDEEQPIALCYTSGTTGRPKGVLTNHRGAFLAAVSNAFEAQITQDSVYLWVLPMFHACGWACPWAVTAAHATHYIIRKVDNSVIWDALLHHGVTHYSGAPTVQIGLVNHPMAKKLAQKVNVAVAASAPTASLLAKMEELNLYPVHVYGLTETYGPFTRRYSEPEWAQLDVDSRARLMARQGHSFLTSDEVRVIRTESSTDPSTEDLIDVERTGKETGEIVTRGNITMLGYYNDKAATDKAVMKGWFHTGDLAVRHPGGEIQILDRGKDIIISGGENISSLMVEQELASHSYVLECCVIARPHEKWGERGQAFIVLTEQAKAKLKVGELKKKGSKENVELVDELRKHCKARMSGFAVPEWFDIVDELPKTSTGKVQKNVLRARFASKL
ncbi:related to AMP-binding protein [Melanopsichium pennsylvanicum]|uniref:Related to AMP-binding protein n=2 Tax=Melanopsichium pennsylvanicum TaxID=63383 RepID=A0AAJ5C646_9BASI|nr:related to AMP-binding protein [Melanopsichium pennsylvanicum 4]SNX85411.1 related to AMP-binding protein [Melanopsichium pennsylvanicum]